MSTLSRRHALLGISAIGATLAARRGLAQTPPSGPFTLPPLPYPPDANEPHIDAQTMQIHHDRHHAAYVANLNAAVKDYPQVAAMGLSGMLGKLGELPDAIRTTVRNNGGGHANHSMFWQLMGGKGGPPVGDLAAAIDRDFGSFDKLKDAFNRAGLGQFGSGWAMVGVDRAGKLTVLNRPNQDTPLMDGGRVLLANDVWEHACMLFEIPEPSGRLSHLVVERGELAGSIQTIRRREGRNARCLMSASQRFHDGGIASPSGPDAAVRFRRRGGRHRPGCAGRDRCSGSSARSGAGKSTLLRMINRLTEPSDRQPEFDTAEARRDTAGR